MYYQSNPSSMDRCGRIFLKNYPSVETFFYPSTIFARSSDQLCGTKGRFFVHKNSAKKCNVSHIMG